MGKKKYDPPTNNEENQDNATLYGEIVPSFNFWLPPDEQRQRADKLENITKPNPQNSK